MNRPAIETAQLKATPEHLPFRMHPRVFAALGADLVTSDVVAIIELVKNSYDAYARNVYLRFRVHFAPDPYLEIFDDGCGMTREIIENVWCLVATPNKKENRFVESDGSRRRVAGEKGLGRLSAARLGERLHMVTKAAGDECWEVEVDWSRISEGNDLSDAFAVCRPYLDPSPFGESGTGTRLRIYGLKETWDNEKVSDLTESLGRLVSPFSKVNDFNIHMGGLDLIEDGEVRIEAPAFLQNPKYRISGFADKNGDVEATYQFASLMRDSRTEKISLPWRRIHEGAWNRKKGLAGAHSDRAHCGAFEFEVRAWDIASDDTSEIAERFNIAKSQIRKSIAAHKGISVYRDDVLVLPKSEATRDWLGLDLRRAGRVGSRLSTSQIVGYVSISADRNPGIEDTSDRERFASGREVTELQEILEAVLGLLERERNRDRASSEREKPMRDLFRKLDATELIAEVMAMADRGAGAADAVPVLREFKESMDSARGEIEERFVYYSRLATVGTIAHMLIHEIRNRTIAIGGFLKVAKERLDLVKDEKLLTKHRRANTAVDALESLTDTFSPLATRGYRRRKRHSVLEERIDSCLGFLAGEIKSRRVDCRVPESVTEVAVDPAELDAILINLAANALYWMADVPEESRTLSFTVTEAGRPGRVSVFVRDTGPGIKDDDMEKVFWPGVTKKPDGIGMGLTVASELVAAYDGRMGLQRGGGEGACFTFDLPLSKKH